MSYEPVLTRDTCYKGVFKDHFSMVTFNLEPALGRIANGSALYSKIIYCNIGNPLSVGQKEITYVRQLISACLSPDLMSQDIFPADVVARAKSILDCCPGGNSGSYQATQGIQIVCRHVAEYVSAQDGYPCEESSISLTNGAIEAIQLILRPIIRSEFDAILVPQPGFPLISAVIQYYGGTQVNYKLDEGNGWGLTRQALDSAVDSCRKKGIIPRAIVIINPNNPTGYVLTEKDIETVLEFAHENSILVIADQVYQHNIYFDDQPFISCRKVLKKLNSIDKCMKQELISLHSVSKSCYGECGRRGGYWQFENIDPRVIEKLLDISSIGATNSDGMIAVDVLVCPPKIGEISYELWNLEYSQILNDLGDKAKLISEAMNLWPGVKCSCPGGALYVYPSLAMPKAAEIKAKQIDIPAIDMYCQDLLLEVGVVVLPGSMFGDDDGESHIRMTILPNQDELVDLMKRWQVFHQEWMLKYLTTVE